MTVLTLTPEDQADLGRLVNAGDEGISLGRDLALSTATRLQNAGFARITEGRTFKAFATGAGRAFHHRSAT